MSVMMDWAKLFGMDQLAKATKLPGTTLWRVLNAKHNREPLVHLEALSKAMQSWAARRRDDAPKTLEDWRSLWKIERRKVTRASKEVVA